VPNPKFQIIHSNSASIAELSNVIYAANPALANVKFATPQGDYIGFTDYLGRACTVDGVDASIVAAMFAKESTDGVNGWAPLNHSLGNIRALPGQPQNGGYRYYKDWDESINDTCGLLHDYAKWGYTDVYSAINKWAPPSDNNDTTGYISFVENEMNIYTQGSKLLLENDNKNKSVIVQPKPLSPSEIKRLQKQILVKKATQTKLS